MDLQLLGAGTVFAFLAGAGTAAAAPAPPATCSILVYHRFGPEVADSMTTRTATLEQQMLALRAHGYRIIALSELLGLLQHRVAPAASVVALTVDDGHRSVFTELLPLARRLDLPLTLFIYPSAIGNAPYAMRWEQLRSIAAEPGMEIGSHTYWHPDFRKEKQRMAPAAFDAFAASQLTKSRAVLQARLEMPVRFLAWPYGISDPELRQLARASGYAAAFALGERNASASDDPYALPRYLITDAVGVKGLLGRLARAPACLP